jgi:hypothetical protein
MNCSRASLSTFGAPSACPFLWHHRNTISSSFKSSDIAKINIYQSIGINDDIAL